MTGAAEAAAAWDVDSAVRGEVFVVWLNDDRPELTGPCGAAAWNLQLERTDDPVAVVERIVRDVVGPPRVVHSTSWRRGHDAVVLTFLVVIDAELVGMMESRAIGRAALVRSEATAAPRMIHHEAVLEHALRHLAWLATDDPTVHAALPASWHTALAAYVPEPFRNLG